MNNGNSVEVADLTGGGVAVRDSKSPHLGPLMFTREEWDAFIGGAKLGEFDECEHGASLIPPGTVKPDLITADYLNGTVTVSWDYREQPPWDDITEVIGQMSGGAVRLSMADTGSDEYELVIAQADYAPAAGLLLATDADEDEAFAADAASLDEAFLDEVFWGAYAGVIGSEVPFSGLYEKKRQAVAAGVRAVTAAVRDGSARETAAILADPEAMAAIAEGKAGL
jgi:hypothetical protein